MSYEGSIVETVFDKLANYRGFFLSIHKNNIHVLSAIIAHFPAFGGIKVFPKESHLQKSSAHIRFLTIL
jgi:hypothetical protein